MPKRPKKSFRYIKKICKLVDCAESFCMRNMISQCLNLSIDISYKHGNLTELPKSGFLCDVTFSFLVKTILTVYVCVVELTRNTIKQSKSVCQIKTQCFCMWLCVFFKVTKKCFKRVYYVLLIKYIV